MEYVYRSAWLYLIFPGIFCTRATSVIYIPIVAEFISAKRKKKREKGIDGETIKGVESYLVTVWKRFRNAFSHRLDRANVDSRKSLLDRRLNTI